MDFETLLQEKYSFILKPQQREAVLISDGPAMLLAVPGSGKTTVIAVRCAHMIMQCGITAENILTLTYNRSTLRDLELRFRTIFGQEHMKGLRFTTMHGLCDLILREYGSLVGCKPPKLFEGSKLRLLRSLYAEENNGEYLPENRLHDLSHSISRVKNRMLTDEQIKNSDFSIKNFSSIYSAYEKYKNANGCIDYDDMPRHALAAFQDRPELLERFRNQYRYINVDESQEISKLQHMLIQLLAAPGNNLFIAGDENQSIFGYTAGAEYVHDFHRTYPNAKLLLMERNYRSTHTIVDAADRLIMGNPDRHRLAMNTGNEIGMPVEETNLLDSSLLCSHLVSRLKSDDNTGNSAILYRDSISAVIIMDALDREGIPFQMLEQRIPFFSHWVVKDILAFMALGHDTADIAALKQIYYKLNASISQIAFNQASTLLGEGAAADVIDALLKNQNLNDIASVRIKRLKENLTVLPELEPERAIQYILDKLEYSDFLKKAGSKGLHLESLLQVVESLKAIASHTRTYQELLERIAALNALATRSSSGEEDNTVTLSTVHAVKGMEFTKVYIIDLIESRFPAIAAVSAMNDGNKEPMEEERRLFYVAVTRACKYVELIYTTKISGQKVKPSRFIRELLPHAPLHKPNRNINRQAADSSSASSGKRTLGRRPAGVRPAIHMPSAFNPIHLEVGMEIAHKAFGSGVISANDVKRDIVSVKFQEHGVKTFAATFCVNGGVLCKPEASADNTTSPQ